MANSPQTGALYRTAYGLPGSALPDSERFRGRVSALFQRCGRSLSDDHLSRELQERTGVTIYYNGAYRVDVWLQSKADIVDVLSFLTLVYQHLSDDPQTQSQWLSGVRKILGEENLLYVVDDRCGVHPKVDTEFQRVVQSALIALDAPKFAAAKAAFEGAYGDLASSPPNYKGAVRNLFECVETVFRLGTGKELKSDHVRSALKSAVAQKYAASDPATVQTADRFVEAFDRWVTAVHPYRHGHGSDVPVDPPSELALGEFSTGAGFARWLTSVFA